MWQSRKEFKERVTELAQQIGVEVKRLTLRPMRTKWASCSTNGQLTFNDELLTLPTELGEYVMVHELVHLKVPNHGKLWKALMLAYCPDHREIAEQLPKRLIMQSPSVENL